MNTQKELITKALKTTDLYEMKKLKNHPSLNVRRALACNNNLDESVLNSLLFDPSQNVCYMASLHPKAKQKREFYESPLRPCVLCKESEIDMACINCPNHHDYI